MRKQKNNMPMTFTGFQWGIAIFCLPILLWPLALLISPNLLKNPTLTSLEVSLMSIFFWAYPALLAILARILYKLHQNHFQLAKKLLILSFIIFYSILYYVSVVGLS